MRIEVQERTKLLEGAAKLLLDSQESAEVKAEVAQRLSHHPGATGRRTGPHAGHGKGRRADRRILRPDRTHLRSRTETLR